MTTVVNTPPSSTTDGGSGMGMIVGIIVVLIIVVLLVVFGLPALRGGGAGTAPAADVDEGTTLEIPDEVQVDVNNPAQ